MITLGDFDIRIPDARERTKVAAVHAADLIRAIRKCLIHHTGNRPVQIVVPPTDSDSQDLFKVCVKAAGATPITIEDTGFSYDRMPPPPMKWPGDGIVFQVLAITESHDLLVFSIDLVHTTHWFSLESREAEVGVRTTVRKIKAPSMMSVVTRPSKVALRAQQRADLSARALVRRAAWIAGPRYGWALEAWRADLEHGPLQDGRPLSAWRKLAFALDLFLVAAPRLRFKTLIEQFGEQTRAVAKATVRVFDSWLGSDRAVGWTVAAILGATGWAAYESTGTTAGFYAGITSAMTTIAIVGVALVPGLRWLRRRRVPCRDKDQVQ